MRSKIPNGWEEKPLIDFCEKSKRAIVDGPFGSNLKTIHYRKSGVPIITSGYVTDGIFKAEEYLYVDEDKFQQEIRSKVQSGDIVMAKIGARCGASAIMPPNHPVGILSGNALKISVDEKHNSTKYVWYYLDWLNRSGKLECIKAVGAQPAVSVPSLKKLNLLKPSKQEQNRIANILSTWDRAIGTLEKLIEVKTCLKKWMIQKLLTGEIRFQEFKSKWSSKRIKDIGKVVSGGTPDTGNPLYWDGDIDWCTPTDITDLGGHKYLGTTKRKITTSGFKNSSASRLPKNSIVVCTRATIGDCAINVEEMTTNQGFKSIIPDGVDHEFLYYVMVSKKNVLARLGNGSTFLEVSKADFESISLNIPTDDKEQKKISHVLACVDRQINLLSSKHSLLKKQKQGLMQKLLTGKIRVKI